MQGMPDHSKCLFWRIWPFNFFSITLPSNHVHHVRVITQCDKIWSSWNLENILLWAMEMQKKQSHHSIRGVPWIPMPKDTSIFPHPNIPHLRSALLVTHKGGIKASCFIVPNVLSLLSNIQYNFLSVCNYNWALMGWSHWACNALLSPGQQNRITMTKSKYKRQAFSFW